MQLDGQCDEAFSNHLKLNLVKLSKVSAPILSFPREKNFSSCLFHQTFQTLLARTRLHSDDRQWIACVATYVQRA